MLYIYQAHSVLFVANIYIILGIVLSILHILILKVNLWGNIIPFTKEEIEYLALPKIKQIVQDETESKHHFFPY